MLPVMECTLSEGDLNVSASKEVRGRPRVNRSSINLISMTIINQFIHLFKTGGARFVLEARVSVRCMYSRTRCANKTRQNRDKKKKGGGGLIAYELLYV